MKTNTVATYGAALASIAASTPAESAVVSIELSPSSMISNSQAILSSQGTIFGGPFIEVLRQPFVSSSSGGSSGGSGSGSGSGSTGPSKGAFEFSSNGITGYVTGLLNDLIDQSTTFQNPLTVDGIGSGESSFIGFETFIYNNGPKSKHFGWFELGFDEKGNAAFLGGAIENTPDVGIRIGSDESLEPSMVPIPGALGMSSLGLLAMGAMGVRRRRKLNTTANATS